MRKLEDERQTASNSKKDRLMKQSRSLFEHLLKCSVYIYSGNVYRQLSFFADFINSTPTNNVIQGTTKVNLMFPKKFSTIPTPHNAY